MNKELQAKFEELLEKAKCPECRGFGEKASREEGSFDENIIVNPCPTCKGTGQRYKIALVEEAELPENTYPYGREGNRGNAFDNGVQSMLKQGRTHRVKEVME